MLASCHSIHIDQPLWALPIHSIADRAFHIGFGSITIAHSINVASITATAVHCHFIVADPLVRVARQRFYFPSSSSLGAYF
jgi:hypothetical protein